MEEKEKLVVMATKLSPDIAEKVKYLAKKTNLSTSRIIANILETVVPDLMMCEKLGVFQLSYLLHDLSQSIISWRRSVQEEPENVGVTT